MGRNWAILKPHEPYSQATVQPFWRVSTRRVSRLMTSRYIFFKVPPNLFIVVASVRIFKRKPLCTGKRNPRPIPRANLKVPILHGQGFVFRNRDSYLGYGCYIKEFGSRARYKSALHQLRTVKRGVAAGFFSPYISRLFSNQIISNWVWLFVNLLILRKISWHDVSRNSRLGDLFMCTVQSERTLTAIRHELLLATSS